MKTFGVLLVCLAPLVSCHDDHNGVPKLEGRFEGTFYRVSAGVKEITSDVMLEFNGDSFEGSSSIVKYPAIGRGNISLAGSRINFTNVSPWTAEFDWSLILQGEFKITSSGEEITMVKFHGKDSYDVYVLQNTRLGSSACVGDL
jgi:hypothetical protein